MVILLTSHDVFIFTIFSFPIVVIAILDQNTHIAILAYWYFSRHPTLDQNVQNTTLMQSHKHILGCFSWINLHFQLFIYNNYCISFFKQKT